MEQLAKTSQFKCGYIISLIIGLFVFSTLLLPEVMINSSFPKLQISDLLLMPAFVLLFYNRSKVLWFSNVKFYVLWLLFGLIMLISLIVNERFFVLQDLFELYKLFKFLFFILFLSTLGSAANLEQILKVSFVGVILFNLLHYFDVLGFNEHFMSYYSAEVQWKTFGLNSVGETDTKRLLGTLGNPNTNSVLFLFFMFYFQPSKNAFKLVDLFHFSAVLAFFACQSRTSLIALGVCVLFIIWTADRNWILFAKRAVVYFLLGMLVFVGDICWSQKESKQNYLTTLSGQAWKSKSIKGRMEVWGMLWGNIKEKPILGHSPNKDFFYSNNIYAESQYVLFAYRYGFVGLILFLIIGFYVLNMSYSAFKNKQNIVLFLFTLVFMISSFTNLPFNDSRLTMIYALAVAIFFNYKNLSHEA